MEFEPCFLCGKQSIVEDKGVLYYRFYDTVMACWVSQAICPLCYVKLTGKEE